MEGSKRARGRERVISVTAFLNHLPLDLSSWVFLGLKERVTTLQKLAVLTFGFDI
jgi:hypothetical protein